MFLSINLISQYGLYFVIAIILFVMPQLGLLNQDDVIAYVIIILFIAEPINNLINLQQFYTRFIVAIKRIKAFISDFKLNTKDSKPLDLKMKFESIEFKNISFKYDNSEENNFALGPIKYKYKKRRNYFLL